ncbi:MAG TPA: DUF1801 domain-containing protein [Stellaceae bacterium]|nr:DUF1801 domain-containing protein [Stellaceae bacterium]HXQ32351.1 DUF1801 domain-containing protein [Steroidobacteraceae bacterium]
MGTQDPRVDAYIAKSAEFAQPILRHLRAVVHEACPTVEETIKWQMPHFLYGGILCRMAAFKHHCAFGFWKEAQLMTGANDQSVEAMGHFGRLTSIEDLPVRRLLKTLIRRAMTLSDARDASPTRPKARRRPPPKPTAYFLDALKGRSAALATYRRLSPYGQREYIEWLRDAKRPDTRARRLATALTWLSQGKSRNWQYQRPKPASR